MIEIHTQKRASPILRALTTGIFLLLLAAAILLISVAAGSLSLPGLPSRKVDATAKYRMVIIDAGHGGEDGGAVGDNGVYEKDLNLDITLTLCDMLRANGVTVLLTRSEDILLYDRNIDYRGRKKVLDQRARLKIAQDNPDAVFVSIHMNAFPQKQYSGLQVYYSKNNSQSSDLAKTIQSTVKEVLQPDNDRKIKPAGSNIYLLHEMDNVSVLIECGFLSNDAECAKLSSSAYRQQLSLALFCAIMEHLDMSPQ